MLIAESPEPEDVPEPPLLVFEALVFEALELAVLPVLELPEVLVLTAGVLPEPVLDPAVVGAALVVVDVRCAARAGSWPETSTTAISSQLATNIAIAPDITRRRIMRARASRVWRIVEA